MARREQRIRLLDDAGLEVVDPGFEHLPLLQAIEPAFAIRSEPLPGFERPRLQALRRIATNTPSAVAFDAALGNLWRSHDAALLDGHGSGNDEGLSLLDLKAHIANRLMRDCVLCARRCGVDRARGQVGVCGLKNAAFVAEHFVHIAEEPQINPSLVLNLRGCALRCQGCQQHALLDTRGTPEEQISPGFWRALDFTGARSLSFVGGNPDESLAAILTFLAAAPATFDLPIVWNNHAYMSEEAIRLLNGVVDCYVPDLKFHNEDCARRYTHVSHYAETARRSVAALLTSGTPVIVRLLLLPGHAACCHLQTLTWLAGLGAENLQVSLRGQFAPDWRIPDNHPELNRRLNPDEMRLVGRAALELPLNLVSRDEICAWAA